MTSKAWSCSPASAIAWPSRPARALEARRCAGRPRGAAGELTDNLVLKAARALADRVAGLQAWPLRAVEAAAGRGGPRRRLGGRGGRVAAAGARQSPRARRSAADAGGARDRRRRAGVPRSAPARDARHRRDPVRAARPAAAAGRAGQSGRRGADQGRVRGACALAPRDAPSAAAAAPRRRLPRKRDGAHRARGGIDERPQRSRSARHRASAGDRRCARRASRALQAAGSRACRARARPASGCSLPAARLPPRRARCEQASGLVGACDECSADDRVSSTG